MKNLSGRLDKLENADLEISPDPAVRLRRLQERVSGIRSRMGPVAPFSPEEGREALDRLRRRLAEAARRPRGSEGTAGGP